MAIARVCTLKCPGKLLKLGKLGFDMTSKVCWEATEEFQARSDMISVIFTNYKFTYYVDSSETSRKGENKKKEFTSSRKTHQELKLLCKNEFSQYIGDIFKI